jgi:hypothetical protein
VKKQESRMTVLKKTRLGVASFLIVMAHVVHAGPVIYEPFEQNPGSISGKAGGAGLNNWVEISTASVETNLSLNYGELVHAGGQLSVANGGNQGCYVTRTSALSDAGLLANGATLWFSYLYLKYSGNGTNEKSGFAFGTDFLTTVGTAGAQMNNGGNGVGMYSSAKAVLPAVWSGGGAPSTGAGTSFVNYGDTIFVVGKIVWGATSNDVETLTIWAPDQADLPRKEADLGSGWSKTLTGVDQTLFDTIAIQQRQSGNVQIYDEISFGATLLDVVALPPPKGTVITLR